MRLDAIPIGKNPPHEVNVVVEVPLLAGESVTSPEVRVAAGKALVNMGPQVQEVTWRSLLAEKSPLALEAPHVPKRSRRGKKVEGMDAAGKGSAIRRVTRAMDARFYRIVRVE